MSRLLPSLLVLTLAAPTLAQQANSTQTTPKPGATTTLRTGTRLVIVDVVVTDQKRNPVHHLKASDFAVFENKTPQPVKSFEEHTAPSPAEIQKIGISRGTPRGYKAGYRRMPELAPGAYFKSVSPAEYHKRFMAQLAALDAKAVLAKIESLAGGKDVALLCYEAPGDATAWCHRAQVSWWLKDELGLEVFEFGMEGAGCGRAHPKLLPEFKDADILSLAASSP